MYFKVGYLQARGTSKMLRGAGFARINWTGSDWNSPSSSLTPGSPESPQSVSSKSESGPHQSNSDSIVSPRSGYYERTRQARKEKETNIVDSNLMQNRIQAIPNPASSDASSSSVTRGKVTEIIPTTATSSGNVTQIAETTAIETPNSGSKPPSAATTSGAAKSVLSRMADALRNVGKTGLGSATLESKETIAAPVLEELKDDLFAEETSVSSSVAGTTTSSSNNSDIKETNSSRGSTTGSNTTSSATSTSPTTTSDKKSSSDNLKSSDKKPFPPIYIDDREGALISLAKKADLFPFETRHLLIGDIQIGGDNESPLYIERKTFDDFHHSLMDGRLESQLGRMIAAVERNYENSLSEVNYANSTDHGDIGCTEHVSEESPFHEDHSSVSDADSSSSSTESATLSANTNTASTWGSATRFGSATSSGSSSSGSSGGVGGNFLKYSSANSAFLPFSGNSSWQNVSGTSSFHGGSNVINEDSIERMWQKIERDNNMDRGANGGGTNSSGVHVLKKGDTINRQNAALQFAAGEVEEADSMAKRRKKSIAILLEGKLRHGAKRYSFRNYMHLKNNQKRLPARTEMAEKMV
jgi:hypothetical protein